MSDPQVKLKFLGDEADLLNSLDKTSSKFDSMTRGIERGSDKAETALSGIRTAADQIRSVTVDVEASTEKATSEIRNVGDSARPVDVMVTADTGKAESDIKHVGDSAKPAKIEVRAETSKAKQALEGLGELGKGVGDKFSGGMASALSGGIAGAIAGIGSQIVSGIADKISAGSNIKKSLEAKFKLPPGVAEQYKDLFQTSLVEDFTDAVSRSSDVDAQWLDSVGVGADKLAETMGYLSQEFTDFSSLSIRDQRALTVEIAKVATAAGVDIPEAIGAAGTAMKIWGMTGWDATRLLSQGFSELGPRGQDFGETINEYSGYFQSVGLDAQDMFNVLKQGLDSGAQNTDKVADAFKELGIRIIDQSPAVSAALTQMGLDAAKVPQLIAAGGPPAKAALDEVIDRLRNMQDPIARNRLGVALFGTQWEDTMRRAILNTDITKDSVANLGRQISGLPDKYITISVNEVHNLQIYKWIHEAPAGSMPLSQGRKAKGGRINGVGTETSDSNLTWLSRNEWVVPAGQATKPGNAQVLEDMTAGRDWRASMSYGAGGSGGGASAGGSGGRAGTLVVSGSADSAVGTMINYLIRTGEIQLQ